MTARPRRSGRIGFSVLVAAIAVLGSIGTAIDHAPGGSDVRSGPIAPGATTSTISTGRSSSPAPSLASPFDQRVARTAVGLRAAGLPPQEIRLPYVGTPARLENGVVVPGPAVAAANVTPYAAASPAPTGIAYYGEDQPGSTVQATTLYASSLAGTLTVNRLAALSLDVDTPGVWGVQLNSVLTNVTLQGASGYQFWTQNAVDYYAENSTISFGEDTWNFSTPGAAIPTGGATIAAQSPGGQFVEGIQVTEGPFLSAPMPFSVTLYLNSSLTSAGDQELWYNYSLTPDGGGTETGNYAWEVFNSTNAAHPGPASLAPFQASGTRLDPAGVPNDFEFDFGIGGFNGANIDDLAANVSATLDYCPATTAACTTGTYTSVPAAEDFGGETGETSDGLAITYNGTTVTGASGPGILRGLWGYGGAAGATAGATAVTNDIDFTGAPDAGAGTPYAFVFLNRTSSIDSTYEWAPDGSIWYLAPGTYHYAIELADYAVATGSLLVGATPTSLTATLAYDTAAGVYTPLWALNDSQLAGISSSGNGSVDNQYLLFDNPTADCTGCGGASNGNLSSAFASWNDLLYPTFAGVLLSGTDAYVDVDHPPTFDVFQEAVSPLTPGSPHVSFYLQIEFLATRHVTLTGDDTPGGWPGIFETLTLAGVVGGAQNFFPTADVVVWNSTDDLIRSNDLIDPGAIPSYGGCIGACPAVRCEACGPTDGLLLYGGTRNTVWGNTFEDASSPGVYTGAYGGLAEAESGDLIYNNNFSVDNPTVYLPFDVYNDSCPFGYAGDCLPSVMPTYVDTWNVSNQSSASVSATVNGFPLSGNVLGAECPTQGGNAWSTYGDALNPVAARPFVNVYNYSEATPMFPPGWSTDQPSIRAGGDYQPLSSSDCSAPPPPTYPVTFEEHGLAAGASWSVTLAGEFLSTTTSTIDFSEANGTYPFEVATESGPSPLPARGNVSVNGQATNVSIEFSSPNGTYPYSFNESGLPAGTVWFVNVTGEPSVGGTGSTLVVSLSNGTYAYTIRTGDLRFAPTSYGGTLVVDGRAGFRAVSFVPVTYSVRFTASGLASGTAWTISVNGTSNGSVGSSIGFALANGTYAFVVGSLAGYSASPARGTFVVQGPIHPISISFGANSTGGGHSVLGLSTVDWILIAAGVLAVVLVGVVVAISLRRSGGGGSPPSHGGAPPS